MRGTDVGVLVPVGTGVIGENCLGCGVAVAAGRNWTAGKVGAGELNSVLAIVGTGVPCPVQAASRANTNKVRQDTRLIGMKYIHK